MKAEGKKKLSAKKASQMTPWDVAAHYGIHYSGDMNPFDHGGYFYTSRDWMAWDYAECVEVWEDYEHSHTVVTRGTINRPDDMEPTWEACGNSDEDVDDRNSVCCQIESVRAYHGYERDDYDEGKSFRENQELAMWRHLLPILEAMASD